MSRNIPNASEMGKRGGSRNVEIHGSEHMAEIGAKGRESLRKKDPDFYRRLSEAGIHAREVKKQEWIKSQLQDSFSELFR